MKFCARIEEASGVAREGQVLAPHKNKIK